MYDCAEELGKSTVWHGASLSLSLSFTLSGPAIRVQDEMLKCCICVFGSQRTGRLFFFLFLSIAPSRFFLSYCPFFKKGRGNRPTKERKEKKNYVWERNRQVLKKTWLRVVREGEFQSKSSLATTRLLFQIKTTCGRQTTSEQKRNLKRLAEQPTKTLYSSLLVSPQRQASTHPCFTVKIVFSFSFLYLMLFSFLTHWQWGPDICRVHLKKKMCQGSVIPPPPSLSLSLSLAHWQGGTSQAHYSQRIYGAEPNAGEKASVNNCREQRTHISRSFEISLGMQLSGIKIKNITQHRQNPTKKH